MGHKKIINNILTNLSHEKLSKDLFHKNHQILIGKGVQSLQLKNMIQLLKTFLTAEKVNMNSLTL